MGMYLKSTRQILPFTHGCEAWYLTSREEYGLKIFENRILRRISEPKRNENGEWRTLHNEELHSLYRSPKIITVSESRRLRLTGHVAKMGD